MTLWAWVLVVAVGTLNVLFNFQAHRAAGRAVSWTHGLATFEFLLLYLIGCTSLVALYTLYSQGVVLARGILLMGTISIIVGTLFGVIVKGKQTRSRRVHDVGGHYRTLWVPSGQGRLERESFGRLVSIGIVS